MSLGLRFLVDKCGMLSLARSRAQENELLVAVAASNDPKGTPKKFEK